jgi:7-cyano-7-deazaguanine synthase in queuosine biosynthesis
MSILVPLSGGPDSIYALKKCIDAGEKVYTYWVRKGAGSSSVDSEVGWDKSEATVHAIVDTFFADIIAHYDFYVDTPIERGEDTFRGNEYWHIVPAVQIIQEHPDIEHISTGICREEYDNVGDVSQHPIFIADAKCVSGAYEAMLGGRKLNRFFLALPAPSKQQVREYIGEGLWHLSYSCTSPEQDGQPCMTCTKCMVRKVTVAPIRKAA